VRTKNLERRGGTHRPSRRDYRQRCRVACRPKPGRSAASPAQTGGGQFLGPEGCSSLRTKRWSGHRL